MNLRKAYTAMHGIVCFLAFVNIIVWATFFFLFYSVNKQIEECTRLMTNIELRSQEPKKK